MIDSDSVADKVRLVRSKSDAPLTEISEMADFGDRSKVFTPIQTVAESIAASLKEPCSLSADEGQLDEVVDAEEAYIAKELGISSKEVNILRTFIICV